MDNRKRIIDVLNAMTKTLNNEGFKITFGSLVAEDKQNRSIASHKSVTNDWWLDSVDFNKLLDGKRSEVGEILWN